MNDSEIKRLALFYFFVFFDEKLAMSATSQSLRYCEQKLRSKEKPSSSSLILEATWKYWNRYKKKATLNRTSIFSNRGWEVPAQVDLGPWKEFQKRVESEDLVILIWSKLLGMSSEEIASQLGLSVGTIQYRIGKSLKKLGQMNQPILNIDL